MKHEMVNFIFFFVLICAAKGFQQQEPKSTVSPTRSTPYRDVTAPKPIPGNLLKNDQSLSPVQVEGKQDGDNGLIEVKEDEIPEGAVVYVLEEPLDTPTEGETLKTADNIVFRPLFRYREKQEAQRRNYNRIRRRYFIPRRSYRQTYTYPYYYYPYRYY